MAVFSSYGITFIVAVAGFCFGLETTSLSAFLDSPQFSNYYGILNEREEYLVQSSNSLGAAVGSILCGALCDSLGSVVSFQIGSIFWLAGTAGVCFSNYLVVFVLGRILKGFALGFISVLVPLYLLETIPKWRKGSSLSVVSLFSVLGSITMYVLGFWIRSQIPSEFAFRYLWAGQTILPIMFVALCFFLPESPKWLAVNSKWDIAAKNLRETQKHHKRKLHNSKISKSSNDIAEKDFVISLFTAGTVIRASSYSELFGKSEWKFVMIGIATQIIVQAAAMGPFMCIFNHICNSCGLSSNFSLLLCSFQLVVLAVFTLVPISLLDSCRRKDSFVFGMFAMGLSYLAIFIISIVWGKPATQADSPFRWVVEREFASTLLSLCLFIVSVYGSMVLSTSWLYTGEIFHGSIRSKGISVSMFASWIANLGFSILVPLGLKLCSYWVFFVLAMLCLIGGSIFTAFPETRGLTELDVENIFMKNSRKRVRLGDTHVIDDDVKSFEDKLVAEIKKDKHEIHQDHQASIPESEYSDEAASDWASLNDPDKEESLKSVNSQLTVTKKISMESFIPFSLLDSSGSSDDIDAVVGVYTASEEEKKVFSSPEESQRETQKSPTSPTQSSPGISYNSSDWVDSALSKSSDHKIPLPISGKSSDNSAQVLDSGNSFFYGNSEGSPNKTGVTYESTTFLQFDKLKGAKRFGSSDFGPKKSSLKGGTFMRPQAIPPKK